MVFCFRNDRAVHVPAHPCAVARPSPGWSGGAQGSNYRSTTGQMMTSAEQPGRAALHHWRWWLIVSVCWCNAGEGWKPRLQGGCFDGEAASSRAGMNHCQLPGYLKLHETTTHSLKNYKLSTRQFPPWCQQATDMSWFGFIHSKQKIWWFLCLVCHSKSLTRLRPLAWGQEPEASVTQLFLCHHSISLGHHCNSPWYKKNILYVRPSAFQTMCFWGLTQIDFAPQSGELVKKRHVVV